MRRVILHIGRHKTGTTAIQRFLRRNAELLAANGFCYPDYGIRGFGHHEIGASITREAVSRLKCNSGEVVRELRNGLDAALHEQNSTVIISSESFQNCAPAVVRKLFDGYDVEVVVYLREQVRYLLSAYAQKVQATDYAETLESFHQANSHSTYEEFLESWETEFPSRVRVHNYDREELEGGNVVVDFAVRYLGLDSPVVAELCSGNDANPSLSRDLLEFKLRVNRGEALSEEHSLMLYKGLANLVPEVGSGGPRISPDLAARVVKRYKRSNKRIARRYFRRSVLFRPYDFPPAESLDADEETRMHTIRNRLISDFPELAQVLPQSTVAESR